MRFAVALGLVLLASTLALALPQQPQAPDPDACDFSVHGDAAKPTITGPDEIVPLVYVVEQPDSPIEILSIDLTGSWMTIANERFTFGNCAKFTVRNRSDRTVQALGLSLEHNSATRGGWLVHRQNPSPLAPGDTVQLGSCNGGGSGSAPGNRVRLMVSVSTMSLGDCVYSPSVRIPRALGLPFAGLELRKPQPGGER